MESLIARLEGAFTQVDKRLDSIDRRLDSIDRRLDGFDQRFNWVIGIIIGTWITTILAVLFHH
jgi:tetrahydromethanopterin S-methyltransferase subunit G